MLRVKQDISNSLNQLQFLSIFYNYLPLTVSSNCACNATLHVGEKKCVYQAKIVLKSMRINLHNICLKHVHDKD